MKSSKQSFIVAAALISTLSTLTALVAASADAARLDMKDPRRALGREDDVRVDAQIYQDTLSSGSTISVTVQVQNLTSAQVAIADKICDTSYDIDTRTITVSVGAEIPSAGSAPHLVTINPGQTKTFTTAAIVRVAVADPRSPFTNAPRSVQIKVNVLRDLSPFRDLLGEQARGVTAALSDDLFERWVET